MSESTQGPRRPARPATHRPVAMQKLMDLSMELEDVANAGVLDADTIEEAGVDLGGVPRATMYAAVALNPELTHAKESDITFVCCVGTCQEWGALDRVEQLLRLRQDRLEDGKKAFDVHARLCLDKCEYAPVVNMVIPDGQATLMAADEEAIVEAVAQACGD